MTFIVDVAGMKGCGLTCYGGEEERLAELQGLPPPDSGYRPAMRNVAPREEEWKPSKSNTQTLPVKGQAKEMES